MLRVTFFVASEWKGGQSKLEGPQQTKAHLELTTASPSFSDLLFVTLQF